MKSKQVDPRRKIKRNILLLSLTAFLIVAALLAVCYWIFSVLTSGKRMDPHGARDITALCAPGGGGSVTARRSICLDFSGTYAFENRQSDRGYSTEEEIQVTDCYFLENAGAEEVRLQIVYPVFYYESEDSRFGMWVDGAPVQAWYGAGNHLEMPEDARRGLVPARLADGTYFARAFPRWPARPEPGGENTYLVYYFGQVRLPAGEASAITITYPLEYADKIRFSPCADEILCTKCALTIENAQAVEITEDNLGIRLQNGKDTLTLDPQREDYVFSFTIKKPE